MIPRPVRPGMTLLELLVSIAIIAILIALLLPAISSVRLSAANVRCKSQIRQLAMALHHYHDVSGSFPPSMNSQRPRADMPFIFWQAKILPYLDQENLWQNVVQANPNGTPVNFFSPHPARKQVVTLFGCPNDERMQTAWYVPQSSIREPIAHTSYLANFGTNVLKPDGVLYLDSKVPILSITDGTSQTLLIGERLPSPELLYGWWYHGIGQLNTGSLDSAIGVRELNRIQGRPQYESCPPGPYPYRSGNIRDRCDIFHYWSLHPGGANFAFADGSVRFLAYSANEIMPALATRAGGEVASLTD